MSTTHLKLTARNRTLLGNLAKKLRKSGSIPAVVYGHNIKKSLNIDISYNEFEKIYRTSGSTSVIDLNLDGKKIQTLVHDLQYHPVKDTFVHVDFLAVNMKKEVETEVPLVFVGTPLPVKQDGAALNANLEFIQVAALPDMLPHQIEVDLSKIESIDDVIRVSDLPKIEGVTFLNDSDDLIASVQFVVEKEDEIVTDVVNPATDSTADSSKE